MAEFNLLEKVTEQVRDLGEWFDREMDERLSDLNPDAGELSDEQVAAFAQHMLQAYPPQWYQHPDGSMELNSIWIIELRDDDRIKEGRKLFERMQKVLQ